MAFDGKIVPGRIATAQSHIVAKKSKYADSRTKQQQLTAWTNDINLKNYPPVQLLGGLFCILIGVVLMFSEELKEVTVDYTHCESEEHKVLDGSTCSHLVSKEKNFTCACIVQFNITEDMRAPVYMFYEMTNYDQNHRLYKNSWDSFQLAGKIFDENGNPFQPSKYCGNTVYSQRDGKIVFPCGLLANSMFNDNFKLKNFNKSEIKLEVESLATSLDLEYRFKNPSEGFNYSSPQFLDNFIRPFDWTDEFWHEWLSKDALSDKDFVTWMKPSALPKFRKIHRKITGHVEGCSENFSGLCKGTYYMEIDYRYDVAIFNGTKSIVFVTSGEIIGDTTFVIWTFFGIGAFGSVTGMILYILHLTTRKRRTSLLETANRSRSLLAFASDSTLQADESFVSSSVDTVVYNHPYSQKNKDEFRIALDAVNRDSVL